MPLSNVMSCRDDLLLRWKSVEREMTCIPLPLLLRLPPAAVWPKRKVARQCQQRRRWCNMTGSNEDEEAEDVIVIACLGYVLSVHM